jgi:hypothetical protein
MGCHAPGETSRQLFRLIEGVGSEERATFPDTLLKNSCNWVVRT